MDGQRITKLNYISRTVLARHKLLPHVTAISIITLGHQKTTKSTQLINENKQKSDRKYKPCRSQSSD